MGNRCKITIQASLAEDEEPEDERGENDPVFLSVINQWLVKNGCWELVRLDNCTDRSVGHYICSGSQQSSSTESEAPEGFEEFILAFLWQAPEDVIVTIYPENGSLIVLRPKH